MKRVDMRINTPFVRRILLVVPVDAPDTRKLKLVVREGEQHDILQFVSDFFELYHMPMESLQMMANEVQKRLPAVVTQVRNAFVFVLCSVPIHSNQSAKCIPYTLCALVSSQRNIVHKVVLDKATIALLRFLLFRYQWGLPRAAR